MLDRMPENANEGDFLRMLDGARAGDESALEALFRRTEERLSPAIGRRMGAAQRARIGASDLFQDTWFEVLRRLESFEGRDEATFWAWIDRILDSAVNQEGRRAATLKRRPPRTDRSQEHLAFARSRRNPTPSSNLAHVEDLVVLSRAMNGLSEDHRRVIMLSVLEGRPLTEVAAAMARSEAATKMLLSRARAALALAIERLEESLEE